jgi:hypothetical protein
MHITIPVTFDVTLESWAAEYGHEDTDTAAADAREAIQQATLPDERGVSPLADMILRGWPALDGMATVTAGAPEGPTNEVEAVRALIARYGLDAINTHVRRAMHATADRVITDAARKAIAAQSYDPDAPAPVAVVFSAYNYENGWFLDHDMATVTFADGTTDTIEIDADLDALNAALNADGACGPESSLAVRLSDGTTDYADYAGDTESVVAGWVSGHKRAA